MAESIRQKLLSSNPVKIISDFERELSTQSQKTTSVGQKIVDFDYSMINPKNWKYNKLGYLHNNWIKLSEYELADINIDIIDIIGDIKIDLSTVYIPDVSIDIFEKQEIIETKIAGKDSSFKEILNNGDTEIIVSGVFVGPWRWQQDYKMIQKFRNVCRKGKTLYLQNPELNRYYGVSKVVVYNFQIRQDNNFQQKKYFSLTLKKDDVEFEIIRKLSSYTKEEEAKAKITDN